MLKKLRKADVAQLDRWRGLGEFMFCYYFGRVLEPTPTNLEKLFDAWRKDRRDRVAHADFACATGALFGDHLAATLDFEWKFCRDEQGEALCLVSPSSGWQAFPVDYVWKRVAPGVLGDERGFFRGGRDFWREKVARRAIPARKSRASKKKR
jgi:hypothetical protein